MLSEKLDSQGLSAWMDSLQPYDHISLIYESDQERDEVERAFIHAGIKQGQKCLYITASEQEGVVLDRLKRIPLHLSKAEGHSPLEILVTPFSAGDGPEVMNSKVTKMVADQLSRARRQGYQGLTIIDDMSWIVKQRLSPEQIAEYVSLVSLRLTSYSCQLLDEYAYQALPPRLIREVLTAYPRFIRGNKLYENPHYIPPQIMLSPEGEEYRLRNWFASVEREHLYGDRIGFLADILERSTQPFLAARPDGTIITCNPAFTELTGYSLQEIRKMKCQNIVNNFVDLQEAADPLNPCRFEGDYPCKNGGTVPIEAFVHRVGDHEGQTKYYYTFINSILQRRSNEKALRDSEALYRGLFTSMQEGFLLGQILYSSEHEVEDIRVVQVNDSFENVFGVPARDMLNQSLNESDIEAHEFWMEVLADVAITGEALKFEYFARNLDRDFEVMVFKPVEDRVAVLFMDITKLKSLEKKLQEQLHFLQNFIDSIPTPAFYRDIEGRFQFCNKAFEEALGLRSDQIIGKSLFDVLPCDLADKYREMDLSLLNSSGIQCYDWEFQYADGTRHDVIFNKAPMCNSQGELIGVVGTAIDITQRKKAQNELRKSEERFRNTFYQSPIGVALYDSQGRLVDMNEAFNEIMGVEKKEDIAHFSLFRDRYFGRPDLDVLMNDGIVSFETEINFDNVRERQLFNTSKRGISFVNYFISMLRSPDGKGDGFLCHIQDVSESRRAQDALKASENMLRRITENMIDMIAQVGVNGEYDYVSPSYQRVMGYTGREKLGSSFYDNIHREDRQKVREQLTKAMREKSASKMEYRYRKKDGDYLYLETVANTLHDEQGQINGAVLGSRDITRRKQMEKELARLDRLRAVGEMAASLGHEIRNPMTTVRGFLQMMMASNQCQEYNEYFDLMIEELDSVNAIISEFLSLAKDKALNSQAQDLNVIIKAIYPLIHADAIKADKQVVLELQDIPEIMLDAKEIRQLVLNMARNGLEAMESGGNLKLGTFCNDREVVLFVEDQGQGIRADVMEKLGTPFFTTKEQGLGLGLPICYNIAARHNAKIEVRTSSIGTTFMVRFCQELEKQSVS